MVHVVAAPVVAAVGLGLVHVLRHARSRVPRVPGLTQARLTHAAQVVVLLHQLLL